jgi:hypothetical protein
VVTGNAASTERKHSPLSYIPPRRGSIDLLDVPAEGFMAWSAVIGIDSGKAGSGDISWG